MNWPEGPYQVAGYHSRQHSEGSAEASGFATQRTCERKFSEELEDTNVVMIPRLVSLQSTRQLQYASERMMSPPGFLLPSLSSEGSCLSVHDGGSVAGSGGNSLVDTSMDTAMHSNPYAMQPVLDMQQFDDSASVDLQQLFPPASMQPLAHAGYNSTQADSSSSGNAIFQHDGNTNTAMVMNEVSNLFSNQASLMTPPTSILTPRTSIVSPMNTFATTRTPMLPPTLQDDVLGGMDARLKVSPDRRKLCCVEGCKSQARAFNRCKRHGGSKRCSHPGCTKSVQSRGLCIRHGGGSRCQEDGCTRAAQSHGKCKMHGGGRPCVVPGCEKKAHLKRLCRKHGGGAKCSLDGCDKWAQRLGMCMTHSKHASPMLSATAACSPTHPAIRSPSTLSDI
ncbi:hypothetical protein ATCC90586_002190 [Pythium insidiosum]|nr:hypothetical protein ATCC90586_002190 [Pythium insidiosum]